MIGTTVAGRYYIEAQIGVGGMGVVYRATDNTLKREVALKVIAPHITEQEGARGRFLREAQALAGLSHPNIVTVYDLLDDPQTGSVYIVMELLRGTSLRKRMADTDRPSFSQVATQLCRALEAAHAKGILHRDVKPENVFVCEDGTLKLMDFGLARMADAASVSQQSVVAGTVAYMAPEQLRSEKVDARTDLYALGIMLYEYLCGQTPFAADNPGAILIKHLTELPPPLRTRMPNLPVQVEAIVMKLLSKDPMGRYPSATALKQALENPTPSGNAKNLTDTLASIPMPTASHPIPSTQQAVPASAIPFATPTAPPKRPVNTDPRYHPNTRPARRRGSSAVAVFFLLLVIGGGAFATFVFVQQMTIEKQKEAKAKADGKAKSGSSGSKTSGQKNGSGGRNRQASSGSGTTAATKKENKSAASTAGGKEPSAEDPNKTEPGSTPAEETTSSPAEETPGSEPGASPPKEKEGGDSGTPGARLPSSSPVQITQLTATKDGGDRIKVELHVSKECYIYFYTVDEANRKYVLVPGDRNRLPGNVGGSDTSVVTVTALDGTYAPKSVLVVASAKTLPDLPATLNEGVFRRSARRGVFMQPGFVRYGISAQNVKIG